MKDELKYPRVFALLEMRKDTYVNFTRCDEVLAYIASPCYLVAEHLLYDKDGTSTKKYDVVFPRGAGSIFYNCLDSDNIPEYNDVDGYTNTITVDFITVDYDEAINKRNEKIKENILNGSNLFLPSEPIETFRERCLKYMKKIEKYQQRLNDVESKEQVKKKIKTPADK